MSSNHATVVPRFSIITPTYQRKALVVSLIESLGRQEYDEPFEVIVVVDGSSDGTADALRALSAPFPLKIIEQTNQGAATARNQGARAARGEILLFIDDDMQADPRLLAEHDRSYRSGADVVIGHMPLDPRTPPSQLTAGVRKWAAERLSRLSGPNPTVSLHDLLTGQMSMAREIFDSVGGFDTRFTDGGSFGNEDIDFGHRVTRMKCHIAFNPRAITWQRYEVDPRAYLLRAREIGRADVLFARKHPDQLHSVFQPIRDGKWINRWFWRHAVEVTVLAEPLTRTVDWLALKCVDGGRQGSLASRLFSWSRAIQYWRGVREAGGIPRPRMLRVLAYHAISDLAGKPVLEDYGIPPDRFRSQLDALQKAGFHFISPDEFAHFINGKAGLPSKALLLTFDDCYEDLLKNGLPILEERKIAALAFAVSSCLGGTNIWDEPIGAPQLPLLDAKQLADLSRRGVEIGSHSRTHPRLTQISDEQLKDEIIGSLDDLEAWTPNRPRFLAYPFGDHNLRVRRAAKASKITAAFTVEPGGLRGNQDRLRVPRIEILRDDTGWKLLWKIRIAPHLRF